MKTAPTTDRSPHPPLRLLPGVVIVVLQWLAMYVLPALVPAAGPVGVFAGLFGGLALVVWWTFFSRAPRVERWGAVALAIAAFFVASRLVHVSIRNGMMGLMLAVYAIPVLSLAFVVWAVAARRLASRPRRVTMAATILLACGVWTLFRTGGITGEGDSDFQWRWTQTPEERLLAQEDALPEALPAALPPVGARADWPGFRGAARDGRVLGTHVATDWAVSPPRELWRRPIGPGWSSFAVLGDLVYTQEQRGDDEVVACYRATTGEPVWSHRDAARFWESNAGAGPRATPAVSDGVVYTLGATGIVNALDAADGSVLWSRDAAADTGAEVPGWGFSSSPLVLDDAVIVQAGALVAYDRAGGELRWRGALSGSYSSPQLLTIDGVPQIVQLSGRGATGVAPADGAVLWEHPWAGSIVQPAQAADGDLLISSTGMSGGQGLRRLSVARAGGPAANAELAGSSGWTAEERWTSQGLKPYFSDFVVHEGHAYGFDGRILASIGLADGERAWKGGRYGSGQLLLLPEQDLLLVVSERGDLALVAAAPEGFTELARLPALEGKTWNHPVLVGDLLLVRNGEEMAAFRLASLKAG